MHYNKKRTSIMLSVGYTHVMLAVSVETIAVFYNSARHPEHPCFVILRPSLCHPEPFALSS